MAESLGITNTDHSNSLKWYIGIFIGVVILFVLGVGINIWLLNEQFNKNEKPLFNSKQTTNPLTSFKIDSSRIYKLKDEDLQKLNNYIDYLTEKVDGEVKRTQENNQYDLDRINTFLTFGICLLAIIGGLLPIFVNFFSKEHLEKRMKDFEDVSKVITAEANVAKEKADKAKSEAEEAGKKVNGLDEKINRLISEENKIKDELPKLKEEVGELKIAAKKVPFIDLLGFQNAIAKFTSTDAMKLFVGNERLKWVCWYLENLTLTLNNFEDGMHSFESYTNENLKYFLNNISELKVALFLGPIRRIPDGRSFQSKIDDAVLQLSKIEKMEPKDFKTQLKVISGIITELKDLVESKIV